MFGGLEGSLVLRLRRISDAGTNGEGKGREIDVRSVKSYDRQNSHKGEREKTF